MINRGDTYQYQIIIAGGGPVGLFLACCLENMGISCIVLEKRERHISHSRSLGIHPVSLNRFKKIGLAAPFIEAGIKIQKGIAFSGNSKLGTISFKNEPLPFNFILSLPQFKTEYIIENHLNKSNSKILCRGAELIDIQQEPDFVRVTYLEKGQKNTLHGKFLVGCDGKNSCVRRLAGISFEGRAYPDSYVMGDFRDNTPFGSDAVIYLHRDGLIESFPMPDGMRRWVTKTDRYISDASRTTVEKIVAERTGLMLEKQYNTMIGSFGVQKFRADPIAKHRVVLAGDAAHIVSPIGGQGMNLGWINVWNLAETFNKILARTNQRDHDKLLTAYSSLCKMRTKKVIRRSEINMKLGRARKFTFMRNNILRLMLNTPLSGIMAKFFTMQKLDKWPV